jgi:hypothetical protein
MGRMLRALDPAVKGGSTRTCPSTNLRMVPLPGSGRNCTANPPALRAGPVTRRLPRRPESPSSAVPPAQLGCCRSGRGLCRQLLQRLAGREPFRFGFGELLDQIAAPPVELAHGKFLQGGIG